MYSVFRSAFHPETSHKSEEDAFPAGCVTYRNKYLMIQDLVRSYHLEISGSRQNGTIAAVGALEYIYDKYPFIDCAHNIPP